MACERRGCTVRPPARQGTLHRYLQSEGLPAACQVGATRNTCAPREKPRPSGRGLSYDGQTSVSDAENSLVPPTTLSISSSESSSPRLAASSSADGRSGTFDSSMTTSFPMPALLDAWLPRRHQGRH